MNPGMVFKPLALGILLSENFKQTYKLCGQVSDIEGTIISRWPSEDLVGNGYEIKNEQRCLSAFGLLLKPFLNTKSEVILPTPTSQNAAVVFRGFLFFFK